MSAKPRNSTMNVVLLVAISIAGMQLWYQLMRDWDVVVASPSTAPPDTGSNVPSYGIVPSNAAPSGSDLFLVAAQRPLFHRDRKPLPDKPALDAIDAPAPAPPQPTPEPAIPPPAETYVLRGTLLTGVRRIALFGLHNSPVTIRIGEGDDLEQWHLEAVKSDHVILSLRGEKFTIPLATPSSTGASGQPNVMAPPSAQVQHSSP
jgi:hypothetical protein